MKKSFAPFYLFLMICFVNVQSMFAQEPVLEFMFTENTEESIQDLQNIESQNIEFGVGRYGEEATACLFNGKDAFVKVPYDINPENLEQMTIICWVKTKNHPRKMTALSHDNGGYDRSLAVPLKAGKSNWGLYCGTGAILIGEQVKNGFWTFIAIVFDNVSQKAKLYVNGNMYEKRSKTSEGLPYFHIGSNPTYGEFFAGAIDDVRIWNVALDDDKIHKLYEEESKNIFIPVDLRQYYYTTEDPNAEVLVRVGDIDNLGFGWEEGFDLFCGESTKMHPFPFYPDVYDHPGTDRIMVATSYSAEKGATDGYARQTERPDNLPRAITIEFPAPETEIRMVVLRIFIDDFQAPIWKSSFQVSLDGKRIPYLETYLNSIKQSGPVGKLITVGLLKEDQKLVEDGKLEIKIDDPITGEGDGFAIDFVELLINPKDNFPCVGNVTGVVKDNSKALLDNVLVSGAGLNETLTGPGGTFILENLPAGLIVVTARKNGYEPASVMVDLEKDKTEKVELVLEKIQRESVDYISKELKTKGTVSLYGIYFDKEKATPKPDSEATLESLFEYLETNPDEVIIIAGHTDSDGSAAYNQELSEQRALSIKNWLVNKGIDPERLKYKGLGENSPVAANNTEAGKALNRRVEIISKREAAKEPKTK